MPSSALAAADSISRIGPSLAVRMAIARTCPTVDSGMQNLRVGVMFDGAARGTCGEPTAPAVLQ